MPTKEKAKIQIGGYSLTSFPSQYGGQNKRRIQNGYHYIGVYPLNFKKKKNQNIQLPMIDYPTC